MKFFEWNEIDFEQKKLNFNTYLQNNRYVVFSAKFGAGKSYFLEKFKEDPSNADFRFFTLYPVNYSVTKNEDVFEYIKRDILVQLSKDEKFKKIFCSSSAQEWIDKWTKTVFSIENLSSVIDVAGNIWDLKSNASIAKGVINILKNVKVNDGKKISEKKLSGFFKSFENERGGLYENDVYTKLISAYVEFLKKIEKKKPVLIIEDLDRMDPAHLFRILNVLGAHIEQGNKGGSLNDRPNKFGFDNIVLVLDYDTTSHIFSHFYGEKADYEGYMSKFMTNQPFFYSLQREMDRNILEGIENYLSSYRGVFGCLENLRKRIGSLSMRDYRRLSNFDTDKYKIEKSHNGYSTDLPVFDILLLMIALGMSELEIYSDLKWKYDLYHVWFLAPIFTSVCRDTSYPLKFSNVHNRCIELSAEKDDNGIVVKLSGVEKTIWVGTPINVSTFQLSDFKESLIIENCRKES